MSDPPEEPVYAAWLKSWMYQTERYANALKGKKMSDPKIVDSYAIKLQERGGFTFVVLELLTSDQATTSYEFHPAFAHALSDELLKASAMAAPRVSPRE